MSRGERECFVVKATSAAHRTLVHDADRWACELVWPFDGRSSSDTTMALVADGTFLDSDVLILGQYGSG